MSQRYQRFGAIALSLALLGVGVFVGVVVERKWLASGTEKTAALRPSALSPPPGPIADRVFRRFQQKLELDEEQAKKVKSALEKVDERAQSIHMEVGPRMEAIMQEADDEIRSILSEVQRGKYEELVEERNARMRGRRGRFRGRPPGESHHRRGPSGARLIERLDTDDDGMLSLEELEQAPGPFGARLAERFAAIDVDGDGLLTGEELRQDSKKRALR